MSRLWELDALRGLMLVLMTLTHLPTRLTESAGQLFGYVSAAEGFVLLSAFMAAMVYGRQGLRDGLKHMRRSLRRRAGRVYLCHLGMLLFLFTFVAALAVRFGHPGATELMRFYLDQPLTAMLSSLVLVYMPPLLDILPLYVLFMIASPVVLSHGLQHGWRVILFVSASLWIGAQFGIGDRLYDAIAVAVGLGVPLEQTGAFSIWAWQFLWVLGLWLGAPRSLSDVGGRVEAMSIAPWRSLDDSPADGGATGRETAQRLTTADAGRPWAVQADPLAGRSGVRPGPGIARPSALPRWAVALAVALALGFLAWRHAVGQMPFGADAVHNLWFDKWTLGPLRLLNLFALVVVAMRFGPWLAARMPRPRFLITLGQASLAVFCAHLAIVLLVLAVLGDAQDARPWWGDGLLLGACFGVLYAVARIGRWRTRRRADARESFEPRWGMPADDLLSVSASSTSIGSERGRALGE